MFGNSCAGFMGFHGLGGLIVSSLFIAIVLIAIVVIFNGRPAKGSSGDDAMKELRMRLARGEITKAEYDSIKSSL